MSSAKDIADIYSDYQEALVQASFDPSDVAKCLSEVSQAYLDLLAENERLKKALHEVDSCFEAALIEGWSDHLGNDNIELIRDIYQRRIEYARFAAIDALSETDPNG